MKLKEIARIFEVECA